MFLEVLRNRFDGIVGTLVTNIRASQLTSLAEEQAIASNHQYIESGTITVYIILHI